MQKLFAIIALLCIAHQPLHAQVVQELNTRSAVKVMVVKDGIGIPQVAALPTNPALLNYNSTAATGSPVWCSCAADTLRRGLNIWNGTAWETIRAAELPGTINWLDSTGETQGRPLFTTVGNKTTTSPYYLFSSTLRKLVINSTNISYGGNDKRLAVNGAALISDLYLDGQLINSGPPSGSTTYPLGWNPSTQQVEKYTEWPGGISYPYTTGKYLNAYGTFAPLISDSVAEGSTNRYFTDARARAAISLTTTGSSGAATYNSSTGVLNIPAYSIGGLGGVPTSRTITINGTTYDLSADRSWTISSGATIAAGATGNIQFRRADGGFSAVSQLTWDSTNQQFRIIRSNQSQPALVFGGNNTPTFQMGWLGTNEFKSLYGNVIFNVNGTTSAEFQANARKIVLNNKGAGGTDYGLVVDGNIVSIPSTVGNAVTIGSISPANGASILDIYITVNAGGYSTTKRYTVTTKFNATAGAWQTLLPLFSSGDYAGEDADLEFSQTNSTASFRLRRTATIGGYVGTTYVTIISQGNSIGGFSWCASSCTGTVTAPTTIYTGNNLTQVNGSVGIGVGNPQSNSILDVVSKNKGSSPFPRMTQSERTAITGSVGLIVYQTDGTEGVYVYKSTGWQFAF